MSNTDTDKLELIIDGLKGITLVGEKVMADGRVDFKDSEYIPEMYAVLKQVAEAVQSYKEMGAEIKDLDGAEAVRLISKIFI